MATNCTQMSHDTSLNSGYSMGARLNQLKSPLFHPVKFLKKVTKLILSVLS